MSTIHVCDRCGAASNTPYTRDFLYYHAPDGIKDLCAQCTQEVGDILSRAEEAAKIAHHNVMQGVWDRVKR